MKLALLVPGINYVMHFGRSALPSPKLLYLVSSEADTIKQIYLHGHKNPEVINPDNWNMDVSFMERPNARQVQMDSFYDYRTNVASECNWQKFLQDHQPKSLIFWGQNDIFFTREGGEAYLKDLPNAEMHRLDSGHFAVEDCLDEIAKWGDSSICFYKEKVSSGKIEEGCCECEISTV